MSFYDKNGESLKVGDKVNVDWFGGIRPGEIAELKMNVMNHDYDVVVKSDNQSFCVPVGSVTKIKPEPHPHAELIKKWADDPSIEIQHLCTIHSKWRTINNPGWVIGEEYRIKPKEKKYVDKYRYAHSFAGIGIPLTGEHYSDEEWDDRVKNAPVKHFTKLEWTKKQFEVED